MKITKKPITAARVGKTKEVIVLQGNYGYGWDDLVEYEKDQYGEAKQNLKEYRENERNASHRLIRRRVPNPAYVEPEKSEVMESVTIPRHKRAIKASTPIKCDYNPEGFAVTGYLSSGRRGAYADRYFAPDEWSGVEEYAHELLMQGLYTNIIHFKTGESIDIDPDVYQENFDGGFDVTEEIADFRNAVWRSMGIDASTVTKNKQVITTSAEYKDIDTEIFERLEFAERVIDELEYEYGVQLSSNAWGTIVDLAKDLEYGNISQLETVIYDIFEEDTGKIISTTKSKNKHAITASAEQDNKSNEDTERLLYASTSTRKRVITASENIIWESGKWSIIYDGYGLGISDGYNVDRPVIYDDKRVGYDFPERLPKKVKAKFESLAKSGKIDNRMDDIQAATITAYDKFGDTRLAHPMDVYDNSGNYVGRHYTRDGRPGNDADSVARKHRGYVVDPDSNATERDYRDTPYLYRVSYGYTSDIVEMDDETTDYGSIVDKLIDTMESEGKTGYLMELDEAEQEYSDDMYTVGGNSGWALIHGGNFYIEPLGWANEVEVDASTNITCSDDSDTSETEQIDAVDANDEADYYKELAEAVILDLNGYYDEIKLSYIISDSAITFTNTANGANDVVYIQPIADITVNWDELENDIYELTSSVRIAAEQHI